MISPILHHHETGLLKLYSPQRGPLFIQHSLVTTAPMFGTFVLVCVSQDVAARPSPSICAEGLDTRQWVVMGSIELMMVKEQQQQTERVELNCT